MRTLASKIQREFRSVHTGHYAVYEDELQRIWPVNVENRRAKIEQFAKEHGLQLSFYKEGFARFFSQKCTVRNDLKIGNVRPSILQTTSDIYQLLILWGMVFAARRERLSQP